MDCQLAWNEHATDHVEVNVRYRHSNSQTKLFVFSANDGPAERLNGRVYDDIRLFAVSWRRAVGGP